MGHRQCEGFTKPVVDAVRKGKLNGHIIKAAGAEDRLCTFWCTRCGAHARTIPKGLARPCRGTPAVAGEWALKLVRQGRDPLDGTHFEFFHEMPG